MKRIGPIKQSEVIRSFLYGYSYDEIRERLGISEGAVVKIIEEFRNGILPVPPDLMTYIDELRHVAVDSKKLNTNPKKMKACLMLYSKILEMNINAQDIEQWLDMCRSIANPDETSEQFIEAALKLARLTKEKGHTYDEVLRDYDLKQKQLNNIKNEIEEKQVMLQLNEEKLKELQIAIKEHIARVKPHLPHKIKPIMLHHVSSSNYQSARVNKCHGASTGHCINSR